MKVRVLGCSTSEALSFNLSSFLVDDRILFDAGGILSGMSQDDLWKIRHILITHSHLDHIKDLPFLAETISLVNKRHFVTVMSIDKVTRAIKRYLFNNTMWPDFTRIPSEKNPIIRFKNISQGRSFQVNSHKITAYKVNHTVPAVGYLIEDRKGKKLLYPGDAGPSNRIWRSLSREEIDGLIIEVSFPNAYKRLALETGHLTPHLLALELKKLEHTPQKIFITHCKHQFKKKVKEELKELRVRNIRILSCGSRFEI